MRFAAAARLALPLFVAVAAPAPAAAQHLVAWGDDTFGQVSDAPEGRIRVAAGGSVQGLALRVDGTPVLWGTGPVGPSGAPLIGAPALPDALATERFRKVALGRNDAVLIRADRTLAAFGVNPAIANVPPGRYEDVAVAAVHAVAIAKGGALVAWGNDSFPSPAGPLTGLLAAPRGRFESVDASTLYSLALSEDGTLFGWGHPANGGNVLAGWPSSPGDPGVVYRPGERYTAIAAGNVHAVALRRDGSIAGWGNGAGGALDAPPHVRFQQVAAGWGFTVGLSTDGVLWGWGTPFNPLGPAWTFASLGWTKDGDSQHYYVACERFESVATAAFHIMAITDERRGHGDGDGRGHGHAHGDGHGGRPGCDAGHDDDRGDDRNDRRCGDDEEGPRGRRGPSEGGRD